MDFFRKNPPTNRRSQIAVIITFVIAVIFLFIAVFINLAKVSQVKTTTSTSADKTALGLASQLGSISHYYKDKVLKISGPCATPPCQVCGPSWLALILVAVGTVVIIPFAPAIIVAGIPAAAIISSSMLGGIDNRFKDMTLYNRLREEALFQALRSMQSDDVELKNTGSGGIFYDDSTGQNYDLSAIPEMRNEKKASRFAAWYYNKRLPLVSDDNLKTALDIFTNGLKRFIITDDWDNDKWRIKKFSYFIKPGPADQAADYQITCVSPGCPDWVKDSVAGKITIMKIDATQAEESQVVGGFLEDKFLSLLSRLSYEYGLTFCTKPETLTQTAICDNVDILIRDLRNFLIKTKSVVEMPVSTRFSNITQWLPLFYDFKLHEENKSSKDNNKDGKIDNDDFSGDVYLRLTRDQNKINAWITELENLNKAEIIPNIVSDQGTYCLQGQPFYKESCYTRTRCGCWGPFDSCLGYKCEDPTPARWWGNYGTCTGTSDHSVHPVCINGDLYGAAPNYLNSNWCKDSLRSPPTCVSLQRTCPEMDCHVPGTKTTIDNSYYFQGQLSWNNTSGPTEVEQALQILRALNYDIDNIKATIARLVDAINRGEPYEDINNNGIRDDGEPFTNLNGNTHSNGSPIYDHYLPDPSYRNEIIYAWQDKPKPDGSKQFLHLVRVKIGGYPDRLPNITESTKWVGLANCYTLDDYEDDFSIITSRYDQDQPTDIGKTAEGGWQLRRRKQGPLVEAGKEFSPESLGVIVADIQDNGKLDSEVTKNVVEYVLNNFAITSCSQAHYGPKKSDIYITGTKCD